MRLMHFGYIGSGRFVFFFFAQRLIVYRVSHWFKRSVFLFAIENKKCSFKKRDDKIETKKCLFFF